MGRMNKLRWPNKSTISCLTTSPGTMKSMSFIWHSATWPKRFRLQGTHFTREMIIKPCLITTRHCRSLTNSRTRKKWARAWTIWAVFTSRKTSMTIVLNLLTRPSQFKWTLSKHRKIREKSAKRTSRRSNLSSLADITTRHWAALSFWKNKPFFGMVIKLTRTPVKECTRIRMRWITVLNKVAKFCPDSRLSMISTLTKFTAQMKTWLIRKNPAICRKFHTFLTSYPCSN